MILSRLPLMEAELACGKLNSAGINALVRDRNMAVAHPLLVSDVPLLVPRSALEHAREILQAPASRIGDDDEDDGYVDEPWRCPKCRRKDVTLRPLGGFWQVLKLGWVLLLVSTIILGIFDWRPAASLLAGHEQSVELLLIAALIAIPVTLILLPRQKHCNACGHEWSSGRD